MKVLKRKEKEKTKLELAQDQAQTAVYKTNKVIEKLGEHTGDLYEALTKIQELFDHIRNVPSEKKLEYEERKKIRVEWKKQVTRIEEDYKKGVGVAVAAMGANAAMGIATTFGVASTGTAIASLSGAAAESAALAWLGGGALAAGGGGMVTGEFLLAMAGPVGWGIAGASLVFSYFMFRKGKADKEHLENIFTAISERDVASYELAIVEINERITRVIDETKKLNGAIDHIRLLGTDYNTMTEDQQYALGSYVNLMNASTQLLVNPIKGLQPKISEENFDNYIFWKDRESGASLCLKYKDIIIGFANLLYKIDLDDKDKILLWKALRKDKDLLKSIDIEKKDFTVELMDAVLDVLKYKYRH